jgi:peptidyl-prolyl cis-trans isomerase C
MSLRSIASSFLTAFLIFCVFISCSDQELVIVATVDGEQITLEEFRLAYVEVIKQPTKFDSPEMREAFLDELIHRRILAKKARAYNLDQNERFQLRSKAFYNKCLRDAHFEAVIKPMINIDEELLREVYIYSREQRKIKQLFFKSLSDAQQAYDYLEQGGKFERLARGQFSDSTLQQAAGDLGWVHWDQMEFDMAMAAFGLKQVGSHSKPVRSSFGYHIIKLESFKLSPLITEEEYGSALFETRKIVETRLGEKMAFQYVEKMMQEVKIKVNTQMLQVVGERLQRILDRDPSLVDQMRTIQLTGMEQASIEDLVWEWRNEPLIYIDDQVMTVGEFVSNLAYVPYHALKRSYKTALDFVIRDARLTQEANELELQHRSKKVALRSKIFKDYQLQVAMRRKILSEVTVTRDEIQKRYEQLTEGRNIAEQDWTQHTDVLQEQLLRDKRSTAIAIYLEELKTSFVIEKNMKPIHDFYEQYRVGRAETNDNNMNE